MIAYAFKFTDTDVKLEELKDSLIYKAVEQADKTGKTKLLSDLYKSSFGADNLHKGFYRLRGWHFNIKKYCKRYLIRFKYDDCYREYFAPNKTTLYNSFYITKSQIREIIEVPNEWRE